LLSLGVAAAYVKGGIVKPEAAGKLQVRLQDDSIHDGQHLEFERFRYVLTHEERLEFLTSWSSSEGGQWPTGT
jgi:hypothetical protein